MGWRESGGGEVVEPSHGWGADIIFMPKAQKSGMKGSMTSAHVQGLRGPLSREMT